MNNILYLNQLQGKPGTDKIRKQAELWDMYAKISPFIFLIIAGSLWAFGIIEHTDAFYTAAVIFGLTAVTWWFWIVRTIAKLASLLRSADDGVQETLRDLRDIKELVKQLRD